MSSVQRGLWFAVALGAAVSLLSACGSAPVGSSNANANANANQKAAAAPGNAQPPLYRCDNTAEFLLRLNDKQAVMDGVGQFFAGQMQRTVLERDNNPSTQSYRSPDVSAEFALGKDGKEAVVRMHKVPSVLRCRQVSTTAPEIPR